MFSLPLKELFGLFLDSLVEVLDLLFELPLQVLDRVEVVSFLVLDLTRQLLLLGLALLQLALQELEFLLKQRLLLVELGLGGHPRPVGLLVLLLLRGNLVLALLNLPRGLPPEGLQLLSHFGLEVLTLLGELGEGLTQGLFLGEGLRTLSL